jgi:hypothetical protein
MIMAGRIASHTTERTRAIGIATAADQSSLNLLLLALIGDMPGVQT